MTPEAPFHKTYGYVAYGQYMNRHGTDSVCVRDSAGRSKKSAKKLGRWGANGSPQKSSSIKYMTVVPVLLRSGWVRHENFGYVQPAI